MPKEINFDEAYERTLLSANCSTQAELANFLETSQSSIADAKRRRSIPDAWLIILFDKLNIHPDYIRFGD